MHAKGLSPTETPEEYEAAWTTCFDRVKAEIKDEADKVRDAGGLYVLGTERHESRRIDNQLRVVPAVRATPVRAASTCHSPTT